MVTYLLKKSYQLKDLKQIEFQDLWGDHGIFTTMWIFGKPAKILFFDNHLKNLISSLKKYQIINSIDQLDEESFRANLLLPEMPDPDLLIRTAGEKRVSNFLLYQLSYTELMFVDTLWPDFDEKELDSAVDEFQNRVRKYGNA